LLGSDFEPNQIDCSNGNPIFFNLQKVQGNIRQLKKIIFYHNKLTKQVARQRPKDAVKGFLGRVPRSKRCRIAVNTTKVFYNHKCLQRVIQRDTRKRRFTDAVKRDACVA
jgi:hypothetical protein